MSVTKENRTYYVEFVANAVTGYFKDEHNWKCRRVDELHQSARATFVSNQSSKLAIVSVTTLNRTYTAVTIEKFAKLLHRLDSELDGYVTYLEFVDNAFVIGLKRSPRKDR